MRGERHGQSAADEGADGKLVVGDRDEVRLEAGGAAGPHDQAVGHCNGPVVFAEIGETHFGALGQGMVGCERDHELLAKQVTAFGPGRFLPRAGAVLEGDREVQFTGPHACRQVVCALVDGDLGVGVVEPYACDGGGDEPGERGRKCADPQPRAPTFCGSGKLFPRELEALSDGVGVSEQDLALAGEPEAAGRTLEQPSADLAFQRRHLVGDRWLRQRELVGGPRE